MTSIEKSELTLIPLAGVAVCLAGPDLPARMSLGSLLFMASALLLFQGLIRDLFLLSAARRSPHGAPRREARCMCVESTAGVTGLAAGAILLASPISAPFAMSAVRWSALAMLVLGIGFLMKDLVFEWNPWRIRRDRDHINIVFTWKR